MILSLQVSVLVIHWHCFQVSYARAQLAEKYNLHERILGYFRKNLRNMLVNMVKKLVIYYNITATPCKSCCDVITQIR